MKYVISTLMIALAVYYIFAALGKAPTIFDKIGLDTAYKNGGLL
jgi:hypothetical protein